MAKHKSPRYVWFMHEALPRNANGKFLKRQLREQLKVDEAA
jgi:long-chain acyl-CoA synthetase